MTYIDGFVTAVPADRRDTYAAFARETGAVFKDHGALQVLDAWGTDVPDGKLTSFPMAVKKEPDEVVVFGWIVWPSKPVRDAAWDAVMKDPRLQGRTPPFDGKRMIFGGFEVVAES